jgi:hypothetical protein
MKRVVLAASAVALLLAPTAGADTGRADNRAVPERPHRAILVRGTALALAPISVRASIGSVVTCEVRNRALIADLAIGDHVLMKCVGMDGQLVLRRLVIHRVVPPSGRPSTEVVRAAPARPASPRPAAVRGAAG